MIGQLLSDELKKVFVPPIKVDDEVSVYYRVKLVGDADNSEVVF